MKATALFFDWWDALNVASTATRIGGIVKARLPLRKKLPEPEAVVRQLVEQLRTMEERVVCLEKDREDLEKEQEELRGWIEVVQSGGAIDMNEPSEDIGWITHAENDRWKGNTPFIS